MFNIYTKEKKYINRDGKDIFIYDVSNDGKVIGTEDIIESDYGKRKIYHYAFTWDEYQGKKYLFNKARQERSPVNLLINNSGAIASWEWSHSWMDNLPDKIRYGRPSFLILPNQIKPSNCLCVPHPGKWGEWSTRIVSLNNNNDCVGTIGFAGAGNANPLYIHHYNSLSGKAFFWNAENKILYQIGSFDPNGPYYSRASDINDLKQVVGTAEIEIIDNNRGIWHAFLWENKKIIDLGVLDGFDSSGAYAINNRSEIIGVCNNGCGVNEPQRNMYEVGPFVWTRELGMINLNDLVDNKSDLVIKYPIEINNNGEILCFAYNKKDGSHPLIVLKPL